MTEELQVVMKKLQNEIFDGVDLVDFKLHVYTVYTLLKHRVEASSSSSINEQIR